MLYMLDFFSLLFLRKNILMLEDRRKSHAVTTYTSDDIAGEHTSESNKPLVEFNLNVLPACFL